MEISAVVSAKCLTYLCHAWPLTGVRKRINYVCRVDFKELYSFRYLLFVWTTCLPNAQLYYLWETIHLCSLMVFVKAKVIWSVLKFESTWHFTKKGQRRLRSKSFLQKPIVEWRDEGNGDTKERNTLPQYDTAAHRYLIWKCEDQAGKRAAMSEVWWRTRVTGLIVHLPSSILSLFSWLFLLDDYSWRLNRYVAENMVQLLCKSQVQDDIAMSKTNHEYSGTNSALALSPPLKETQVCKLRSFSFFDQKLRCVCPMWGKLACGAIKWEFLCIVWLIIVLWCGGWTH